MKIGETKTYALPSSGLPRKRLRQPQPAEMMKPADLSESIPPARTKKLSEPENVRRTINAERDKHSRFNDIPSQPVE